MFHTLFAAFVLMLVSISAPAAVAIAPSAELQNRKLLIALLNQETEGFASPNTPWRFSFPADHAPHRDFWTESWHFTGNASSSRGRRFGFQLTFVRIGIHSPRTPLGPSAFAARDVYWAQFALSDAGGQRAHAAERMSRAALGMAGAQQAPVRVWLHEWVMEVSSVAGGGDTFALKAADQNVGLEISLRSVKRPLLSTALDGARQDATAANPFHAYALTRLVGEGAIRVGTETFEVEGQAWLDRAWGRIPAPVGAVVWDRFSVQLDDGRELLALRMRRRDGGEGGTVSGIMIERDGSARALPQGELQAEITDYWSNPQGRRYPVGWRLRVPGEHLEVQLAPIMEAQERTLSFLSWAGAMRVSGSQKGQSIRGSGYIELASSL